MVSDWYVLGLEFSCLRILLSFWVSSLRLLLCSLLDCRILLVFGLGLFWSAYALLIADSWCNTVFTLFGVVMGLYGLFLVVDICCSFGLCVWILN